MPDLRLNGLLALRRRERLRRRQRSRACTILIVLVVFVVGVLAARTLRLPSGSADPSCRGDAAAGRRSDAAERRRADGTATSPSSPGCRCSIVGRARCLAAVGVWWSARARGARWRARRDAALAEALEDVLDESLDDLRAEPDPRRAVIAAYARLERVLAAHGLPRRPRRRRSSTCARMLAELAVSTESRSRG